MNDQRKTKAQLIQELNDLRHKPDSASGSGDTERKQAEEESRKSQQILLKAEELSNQGSWEWNVMNDQWKFSDNWLRIHGCKASGISRKELMTIAHPDDAARIEKSFQNALAGRGPYSLEHRIVRQDDESIRVVGALGEVEFDNLGQPIRMFGVAQDITERKLVEEELAKAHKELESRVVERTLALARVNVQLQNDIAKRKRVEKKLKHSREQLRNLAQHIESVRELKRAQIARDVHDDLGQSLAALKLDLSWLKRRIPENLDPLLDRTKSMSQLIDSMVRRVREISAELRPGVLDDFGLMEAIRWQAQIFQNRTGIKCKLVQSVKNIPLDKTQATSLFRIFQESLTNVALHTHATEIEVSLVGNTDRVLLEIMDNGRGITNRQISSPKSLGIHGMRERALFLGGKFNISGIKRRGTTVSIRVPLSKIRS